MTSGSLRRWLALFAALSVLAAACGGGDDDAAEGDDTGAATEETADAASEGESPSEGDTEAAGGGEAAQGGTVVIGQDQEPNILNPVLTEGNLVATSQVTIPILASGWRITPDFEYEPWLFESGEVVSEDPFTVRWVIKDEATWSDGTPITAEDIQFTIETNLNEEFDITSRDGVDQIDLAQSGPVDEKTYEAVFTQPYAPWQTLFSVASGAILPRHCLEGQDFNTVWNEQITCAATDGSPISSGPFIFEEWQRGVQLRTVRNDDYWGTQANLEALVYRPITDTNTLIQQFRGGEVDVISPQPQLDLIEQIEAQGDLEYQVSLGPSWQHLDFNFERGALGERFVRQAIAQGIDRTTIVEQLVTPIAPDVTEPLNNVIYVSNQEEYEPNWEDAIPYDPEAARSLLEENGCTEGADGIYECPQGRLEFGYVTTGGNQTRELIFEIVQQQLQEIGVRLNADFGEGGAAFERLAPMDYDLFQFAWVGSPDPVGGNTIWQCSETTGDASLNYTGYCNPEVDQLIQQTNATIDPAERAELYNQADTLIAQDVPVIPLFQFQDLVAYNARVQGIESNPTQASFLWNVEEWSVAQ